MASVFCLRLLQRQDQKRRRTREVGYPTGPSKHLDVHRRLPDKTFPTLEAASVSEALGREEALVELYRRFAPRILTASHN